MKVFYINLEKRKDRKEHMEKLLSRLNVEYTRFEAICPTYDQIKFGKYKKYFDKACKFVKNFDNEKQKLRLCGVVGVYLSHLKIHQTQLGNTEPYLILEDDVKITENTIKELNEIISNDNLNDWDIIRSTYHDDKESKIKKIVGVSRHSRFRGIEENHDIYGGAHFSCFKDANKIIEYFKLEDLISVDALYSTSLLNVYTKKIDVTTLGRFGSDIPKISCTKRPSKRKIKVKNVEKKPGLLHHYGHFFHDAFMPEVNLGLFEYDQIIRLNTHEETIGVFGDIYNLLGLENIEVSETEFNKIECEYQPVKPYHCNGFETDDLIKFRNFIDSKLSLSNSPKTQIILIKRGYQQLLKNSKIPSYTGVKRREISEINKLESLLNRKGYNVKSVVLENLDWPSQVGVFKSADTIIGAHGAGLCNVTFCDPGTNVIEVKFSTCRTFQRMSKLIGLNHYWVDNSIEKIMNLVERIAK